MIWLWLLLIPVICTALVLAFFAGCADDYQQ